VDLAGIEALIKEGREAVEQQDDAKITDVSERLEKEAHQMASKLYETPPGPGAPTGTAPSESSGGGGKGDVIDAEFEETN
jgi:molecular chaperone DnaK